jgi:uncharacterized protein (TIGR02246 family)
MPETTDVVDAQIAAYRNRDLERFLGCYSPDVVIKDISGNVVMGGLDVMREQYGQLFRDSPELTVDIPQRRLIGDYVIDEEQVTGFNLPGYPAELHAVVAYQVTNGKIHGVTFIG